MFGRKKFQDDDKAMTEFGDELGIPVKPAPRTVGTASAPVRSAAAAPVPRPLGDAPKPNDAKASGGDASRGGGNTPQKRDVETRKLIVGREISLSGEITACDRLVVEGSVEANLANCRDIDIAESGLFKGSASIDDAEVRGRFEGTLNVRRRLLIRATGKVTGNVRYGQIEIECGGQISGDVQAQPMAEPIEGSSKSMESMAMPRPTIVPLS
jgi:cytoskeletal protein CcmA (bactofilin family)